MKYQPEYDHLKHVEETSDRRTLSDIELNDLRKSNPNISEEYLIYLKEIGAGSFKESQFMVYEDLMNISDLGLDDIFEIDSNLLFFGDNFGGDLSGFDFGKDPNEVIEFWHNDGTIFRTGKTFKEYIKDKIIIT